MPGLTTTGLLIGNLLPGVELQIFIIKRLPSFTQKRSKRQSNTNL